MIAMMKCVVRDLAPLEGVSELLISHTRSAASPRLRVRSLPNRIAPPMAKEPNRMKSAARQSGSFQPPKSSAVAIAPRARALMATVQSSPIQPAGLPDRMPRIATKHAVAQVIQRAIPIVFEVSTPFA